MLIKGRWRRVVHATCRAAQETLSSFFSLSLLSRVHVRVCVLRDSGALRWGSQWVALRSRVRATQRNGKKDWVKSDQSVSVWHESEETIALRVYNDRNENGRKTEIVFTACRRVVGGFRRTKGDSNYYEKILRGRAPVVRCVRRGRNGNKTARNVYTKRIGFLRVKRRVSHLRARKVDVHRGCVLYRTTVCRQSTIVLGKTLTSLRAHSTIIPEHYIVVTRYGELIDFDADGIKKQNVFVVPIKKSVENEKYVFSLISTSS
jgi:hypothetical protein